MDTRFVADVRVTTRGGRSGGGTGYLVGPTLVLTSAHVLDGHDRVRVRLGVDRDGRFLACEVCWEDRERDVALLRLEKEQPPPRLRVRWGAFAGTGPQRYEALGYPDLALSGDDPELKHLQGSLKPAEGLRNGELRLNIQREYVRDVPWEGFSGTAVFTGDLLVGVVLVHNRTTGYLHARRSSWCAEQPEFVRLVEEDTGAPLLVETADDPSYRERAHTAVLRFHYALRASLSGCAHTLGGAVRRLAGGLGGRGAHERGRAGAAPAVEGGPAAAPGEGGRGTGRPARILAATAAALLVLVPGGLYWWEANGFPGLSSGCAPPTELTVLTTPDQHAAVQRAAEDFAARQGARDEDGCVPVRVSVTAAGGAAVTRELLRDGWNDLRAGPRPHVWLPDSGADVALLRGDPGDAPGLETEEEGATRLTPLVLGLPESASGIPACSGTDPGGARSDLVVCTAAATEAGLLLARPSPEASTSALIQTGALYSAYGDGGSEEIQVAEARATSAGLDAEGNLGLLCALRGGDADPATVGVFSTEYAISAYNGGRALGPGCGPTGREPDERLVPVYFSEVPGLDHPFVRLDWGGDDGVGEEVEAFGNWMGRPGSTEAFHGYRTVEGDMIGGEGARSAMEVTHLTSDRDEEEWRERLESSLRQQERSRTPVEVLIAVDRSDSMNGPGTGGTRLETAQKLARTAVDLLGEQDTVGVWAFPEGGPGNDVTGQERVLPPEPGMDARREESAREEIDALTAEFPATPLADAVLDGAEELESCADRPGEPGACALVVLTDGVALPEPGGGARADDVAAVLEDLDERVRVHMVSVGDEGCGGDGLLSRLASAGAECHHPRADELEQVVYGIVAGTRAATP
ncbi:MULTISPECIES: trypsin-like peptidase domain-containing protein [Nocardiopsis]|uniref:Peptidase S1 n=1 Tax=Nocardiopsis sinuspersici TaxID=501010 RepID=A0A1V3C5W4_9ACTN|nr:MULTISPECIES: trypsin-like peptidase domain-containing protein [Nocardiopsis]OOC56135.1 peptidase S1 [Nocardiopsis sinuspersici]